MKRKSDHKNLKSSKDNGLLLGGWENITGKILCLAVWCKFI